MADKHAYVTSPGNFVQLIDYLRRTFPAAVTAETVKKLGIAPKNESYLVSTLRFLGLIDEQGNKTEVAANVFSQHSDEAFQNEFAQVVEKAYPQLFALHGADAWDLEVTALITFFRQNDKSSDPVGRNQARTFKCLARLAGHGDAHETTKKNEVRKQRGEGAKQKVGSKRTDSTVRRSHAQIRDSSTALLSRDFALTVRVEINLPAEGDQETYDRIFKSIRENLLNG